jgi:hypothetical protein
LPKLGYDAPDAFTLLLPGFLAYAVFCALQRRGDKLEATNAVLNALGLTLVVHITWYAAKSAGSIVPTPDVVGLTVTSIIVGLGLCYNDEYAIAFRLLRKVKFTDSAPWHTIWLTAFNYGRGTSRGYVVLHFKDTSRRIIGYVAGFPRQSQQQHILLTQYRWLHDNTVQERHGSILISLDEVSMVEFLDYEKEMTVESQLAASNPDSRPNPSAGTTNRLVVSANSPASPSTTASPTAEMRVQLDDAVD